MNLLFPLGLAALAAWLLPLLIHLARRHPYTPLDFAALRWLRAQIRPRQRIRFDDWPLLLLRLLLLAALAVLLARPALTGPAAGPAAWTVVAPGLDAAALRGTGQDDHWYWLAPGFPAIDQAPPASSASLPSLLRELDAQLPAGTTLTVHVPDPLPGLDGARLQLSREVRWRPQPVPPTALQPPPTPPRLRAHSEASATAQRWLGAVQRAWGAQVPPDALAADALPEPGEIGVWSLDVPLPSHWQAWLREGGSVLTAGKPGAAASVVLLTADGAPLLWQQRVGHGRLLSLPGDWNAGSNAALRDPQLPRALLLALRTPPSPQLGDARNHAPQQAVLPAATPPVREPTTWLLLGIVLLFALERWMASRARRGAAA